MSRYKCEACGNITRFDVTETRTTKSFYHYAISGQLNIEDVEVVRSEIDSVECRWCGHGKNIVLYES